MGQEMGHAMRQTRVRRRIQELDQAQSRNASKHEDYGQKLKYIVTPRRVKTGINGLSEDFPEELKQHEKSINIFILF